jgi:hypothetical protein
MNEPLVSGESFDQQPRYEVWLAERELLSSAALVRDARTDAESRLARAGYGAAWMRFMVALCNLSFAERPVEVERVLEALRQAHLMRSRGELISSPPFLSGPPASPDAGSTQ